MKKKNLLTLGALVLSLGLTVTSCAGAKGEDGAPGKDGTNGTNGKDGKDGADGKTYIPVIVNSWLFGDKVEVTQDAYFVEPGETVTFTFKSATTEVGEILSSVKFNGVEYLSNIIEADDKGVATLSVTTSSADKGYQMTAASFSTVEGYAYGLVEDHLDELKEKDSLLLGTVQSDNSVAISKDAEKTLAANNTLADSTFVATNYAAAVKAIDTQNSADEKAKKTISERVTSLKAVAEAQNTAIDTAYATLINNTKTSVKADGKSANDKVMSDHSDYLTADKDSIYNTFAANIDACTTLEAMGKYWNASSGSKAVAGSFNILTALKSAGFTLLEQALSKVAESETAFGTDTGSNTTHADALKVLKDGLALWGVSVDSLPSEIYASAVKELSAATEIETKIVSNTTVPAAAYDASQKISKAVQNLKDELVKAVEASYKAEISESSILGSSEKVTFTSGIETAVTNWVKSDSGSVTLDKYYGSETGSLVAACEYVFTTANNTAFNTARVETKVKAALNAFKAKVAELKAADSDLAKVNAGYSTSIKPTSSSSAVSGYLTVKEFGDEDTGTVANPFGTVKEIKNSAGTVTGYYMENATKFTDTSIMTASTTSTPTSGDTIPENLDEWYQTLYAAAYDSKGKLTSTISSAQTAIQWQAAHIGDFGKIYKKMVAVYAEKAKTDLVSDEAITGTYLTASKVQEQFDTATNKDLTTLSAVTSLIPGTKSGVALINAANTGIANQVVSLLGSDKDYHDYFVGEWSVTDSDSLLVKAINSELKTILAGSETETGLTSWINNLSSVVASDVANLKSEAVAIVKSAYNNIVTTSSALTASQLQALNRSYNTMLSWLGHKVVKHTENDVITYTVDGTAGTSDVTLDYTDKTLTAIQDWRADVIATLSNSGNTYAIKTENAEAADANALKAVESAYIESKLGDGASTKTSSLGKALNDLLVGGKVKLDYTSSLADPTSADDNNVGKSAVVALSSVNGSQSSAAAATNSSVTFDFADEDNLSLFKSLVDAVVTNQGADNSNSSLDWTNVYVKVTAGYEDNAAKYTINGFYGALEGKVESLTWNQSSLKSQFKGYIGKKITVVADGNGATAKIVSITEGELKASDVDSGKYYVVLDLSTDASKENWDAMVTKVAALTAGSALTTCETGFAVTNSGSKTTA